MVAYWFLQISGLCTYASFCKSSRYMLMPCWHGLTYSSESEVGKLLLAMVGSICSWWWTVFAGDSGQYLVWCKLCNNALFEFCTSFSVLSVTLGKNFFGNRSLFASSEWQDQIFSQIKLYLQTKACRVRPAEGLISRKTICAHNNFRRSSYLMSKVFFGEKSSATRTWR